jgi:Skp family chaperone for outer membrane proteins
MARFSFPKSMYTYAFLLNLDRPIDLPEGIWGSLELVCLHQLAALIEPNLTTTSLHQSDWQLMQAVLSHDRVIQEVFQQTVVLPLRFGTYFISRQGLLDHLRTHQQEYLNKLTHLQGKAEYVLKLVPVGSEEATIAAESSKTDWNTKQAYQTRAEWQQQQTELRSLLSLISEYYPETVRGDATEGIERIYLLCAQPERRNLLTHLQKWQAQFRYWKLNLGETLPPYHFV